MPSGPFDNVEVRGPFSDDNLWVRVALEDPEVRTGTIDDRYLRELEEKAVELSIYEGEGQAFATTGTGPGRAVVHYRTFYLENTGADAEEVVRQSKRLANVSIGKELEINSIKILCETPSPTQDVLPSQIDPVFRSSDK